MHEDGFFEFAIEEGWLNINLVDLEVIGSGKGK